MNKKMKMKKENSKEEGGEELKKAECRLGSSAPTKQQNSRFGEN